MSSDGPTPPTDETDETDTGWAVTEQRAYHRDHPADLTTVVIEAVAAAEGVDPPSIKSPPLYEVVDTAALEATFFGPRVADERRAAVGNATFHYRGFRVTVRSDGWVQVAEPVDQP